MRPLAQTFFVSKVENPNGVFVTSVDLFFAQKDDSGGWPFYVELRGVENGVPSGIPYPGSTIYARPSDINLPAVGDSDRAAGVLLAPTTFTFDEPIYLTPGYEYALAMHSNSEKYRLYCSRIYEYLLGTTEKRVNKQQGLQTLYLAQASDVWVPDFSVDLVATIRRAEFTPNVTYNAFFTNNEPALRALEANPFITDSASTTIRVLHSGHGFVINDFVNISGLDSSQTYNGIKGTSVLGNRQISAVDHTGYTITADSAASSSLRTGGDGVIVSSQIMFDKFLPVIDRVKPFTTQIGAFGKFADGASYAGFRNDAILNDAYNPDGAFTSIQLNEFNANPNPKILATSLNETTNMSGTKSVTVRLDLSSENNKVSPFIDLQRCSITTIENVIDRQDSAASNGFNVPLSFVSETDPSGGSSAAKHITVPVTLAETAVGLKILLGANRPAEADFDVYYRVSTGDEILEDKNWIEIEKEAEVPADIDPNIFREYSYLVGGLGGTLAPFTVFQVKIVLNTTNSSKIPRIRDLRAIALVT